MTPSEREKLARWFSRYHQQHRVENRGVTWEDGNAYLNWLDENAERIAAALREPVGEPDLDTLGEWHTVAQECSAKLAGLKRWIGNAMRDAVAQPASAEPADRLDRVLRVSQAGTAGSASVITEAAPAGGQPQPATTPPTHECPTNVGVTANCPPCEMAADAVTVCDALRAEVEHQTRSADATHKLLLQMQDRALKAEADVEKLRGVVASDDERLRDAAVRVWGEHPWGCDTADHLADTVLALRAEVERLKAESRAQPQPATAAPGFSCDYCGYECVSEECKRCDAHRSCRGRSRHGDAAHRWSGCVATPTNAPSIDRTMETCARCVTPTRGLCGECLSLCWPKGVPQPATFTDENGATHLKARNPHTYNASLCCPEVQPATTEDRPMVSLGDVLRERDALRAEVERLRPVVEEAERCVDRLPLGVAVSVDRLRRAKEQP